MMLIRKTDGPNKNVTRAVKQNKYTSLCNEIVLGNDATMKEKSRRSGGHTRQMWLIIGQNVKNVLRSWERSRTATGRVKG